MSQRRDVHEPHKTVLEHDGVSILVEKKDPHVRVCDCIIGILRKEASRDQETEISGLSLWMHWLREILLSYGVPEDQIDIVFGGVIEATGENPYYLKFGEDPLRWELLQTIEKISEHGAGFFKALDLSESYTG